MVTANDGTGFRFAALLNAAYYGIDSLRLIDMLA
jgi:hypothetical protein